MAGSGVNLAITKDGGSYNKLQRPQDYLTANTAFPPPKDVSLVDVAGPTINPKRKREQTDGTSKSKRKRQEQETVQTDLCGMRTTLPGLDDEDFASDDSTSNAIAYLRSVRSEASAIPNLLGGSTTTRYESIDIDEHVHFQEGAWISFDPDSYKSSEEEANNLGPQDQYYQLLLKRFDRLRTMLATIDELHNASSPEHENTTTKPYFAKSERAWSDMIEREPPNPHRLAHTDEAIIYRGLKYCSQTLEHDDAISGQHSCWIWSLLAAVHDVGTLDNDKISRLRDLGQRAGLMGARLKTGSTGGSRGENNLAARDQSDEDEGDSRVLSRSAAAQRESSVERASPSDTNESDAAMSMSGDDNQTLEGAGASSLEQARERLLAQLGDRLVHAQAPPLKGREQVDEDAECKAAYKMRRDHRDSPQGRTDTMSHLDDVAISSPGLNTSNAGLMPSERPQQTSGSVMLGGGIPRRADAVETNQAGLGGAEGEWADINTKVTIDMILTIVAESFGQRDLLKYRGRW